MKALIWLDFLLFICADELLNSEQDLKCIREKVEEIEGEAL